MRETDYVWRTHNSPPLRVTYASIDWALPPALDTPEEILCFCGQSSPKVDCDD
jgi:hypothetical protein